MADGKNIRCLENTPREWAKALAIGTIITLFFWWYHYLRGRPFEIFTLNKSIAIAGTLQLGLTLICGPLHRFGMISLSTLRQRRTLGLVAMLMLAMHLIFSIFFLSHKFPLSYYSKHPISLTVSIMGMILLAIVSYFSFKSTASRIAARSWKEIQRLAWLGLSFGFLHFMLLDKIPNWVKWFKNYEPIYPPGTMLPGIFTALVLTIFVVDVLINRKRTEQSQEELETCVTYSVEKGKTSSVIKQERQPS